MSRSLAQHFARHARSLAVSLLAILHVGAVARAYDEPAGPTLSISDSALPEISAASGDDCANAICETGAGSTLRFVAETNLAPEDEAVAKLCAAAKADVAAAELGIAAGALDSAGEPEEISGAASESEASATADGCVDTSGDNELWIISTRNLPALRCGCEPPAFTPSVRQYICGQGWRKSSLEEFLASDDGTRVTMVFVHGNDTEYDEAIDMGRGLYKRLVNTRCEVPPTRLVIWSWPSEKDLIRVRKAAQEAACRTKSEGFYLAEFVDLLPENSVYSLCGYSYGARVVTGGLNVLGGGIVAGHSLPPRQHPEHQPANVMLIGAAMDNNAMLPGREHSRALSQVERMVILFNPEDRVLFWYQHLWQRRGPEALGSTGQIATSRLGADRVKLKQINVEPQLGKRHSWKYVSASSTIVSIVRRELLAVPAAEIANQ